MNLETSTEQSSLTTLLHSNELNHKGCTSAKNITPSKCDPFGTFGTPELCMWRFGPNTCRFQTIQPCIARKLSQRSGAALVAYSLNGSYLRVFQEKISPRLARKLVIRYLKGADQKLKATNARFLGQNATANASELAGSINTAARQR